MIYLDNAATTSLTQEVKDRIISELNNYGNPSATYDIGYEMREKIEQARDSVAKFINANVDNVYFTPSGSASNTIGCRHVLRMRKFYTTLYSPIGHKSLIKASEMFGYPLKVNYQGRIDLDVLEQYMIQYYDSEIVAIDYANSEIGTIQDVRNIIDLVHKYNKLIYLDCTGSIPYIPLDVKDLDVDMCGFSGHKLGALKGCGVFYKKPEIKCEPLVYGAQENGLIGGTENVLGILSLDTSVRNYKYNIEAVEDNRDYIYANLRELSFHVVGSVAKRLPNNLYLQIDGINGQNLVELLNEKGVCISTGSACNNGTEEYSPTLKAIGMDSERAKSCIRITVNGTESKDDLYTACKLIKESVEALR